MIEVQHPGMYTSIQDMGRYGHRRYGVPLSGVMDRDMAIAANEILGNDPNDAVLEFTHPGPTLFFTKPAIVCISGAPSLVYVNQDELIPTKPILVETNSTVKFGRSEMGLWSYMAVKGGFLSEVVLDSRSYFRGITKSDHLAKGDILEIANLSELSEQEVKWGNKLPEFKVVNSIEVYPGPEYAQLSEMQKFAIFEPWYEVSAQSNRMATLVRSGKIVKVPEIITGPVQPGTVQLTPSGKMIILMRDAQTTGGYARVLQLTKIGITNLSRLRPGEKFTFRLL